MVTVLYFAAARERAGIEREVLDLEGKSVTEALAVIALRHPRLAEVLPHCRAAVNQRFTRGEERLDPDAELAIIPPVAGGSGERVLARVREDPLSVDDVLARVATPGAGAQVVLIGTVRDKAAGEAVTGLRYEAYAAMAERVIADIVREVEAAFPGVLGAVDHRVGELQIGERAVVVAASAPHRGEAFTACQRIIDRLKEDAPIWKHEARASGVVWVGLGP